MAITNLPITNSPDTGTPLLDDPVDGCVDYKGRPVHRSSSGGWRSVSLIIGVEVAESFALNGIVSNLITFLTGPLGQSTATAAENVNAWSGVVSLLPLLGAFIADSFLGRYRTIVVACLIYIMGLGLLTLAATIPFDATSASLSSNNMTSYSSHSFQVILFFFSLYLVALANGGYKPCIQAFGADQFDGEDPEECMAKSSFFNWWNFCMYGGTLVALWILNYIQDNLSWALGFGISCIAMIVALIVFLVGTNTYRYSHTGNKKSPFVRIGRVFIVAARNWRAVSSAMIAREEACGTLPNEGSKQYEFLNKALLAPDGSVESGKVCTIGEVEEAKAMLRLVPIWATCLIFAVVYAQSSTFFTKQGATMDRSITIAFDIPSASLNHSSA
ncbi:hypothetical protein SLA2020_020980 [Shorea laevis]